MSAYFDNLCQAMHMLAEDLQLGMAIGAALAGDLPICVYPRINFMLLATNQLVLHLDKLPLYSGFRPRVIVRTAVATPEPLDPGPQHLGDFTQAYRQMLRTVEVVDLYDASKIVPAYREAMERDGSTLLVEHLGRY
jgi:pyruvate/2-oxoglutarate/acetoin dehydrogenase E1 component